MDEFISDKVQLVVQELVYAQVISEVKNHASTLVPDTVVDFIQPCLHKVVSHVLHTEQISLTTTSVLSTTSITVPKTKERLYEMMSSNLKSIECEINNDLYIALSKSVHQDKQVVSKYSCKDANLKKRSHDD
nr:hypothetical protein [Tanacetum cinerariifolium]